MTWARARKGVLALLGLVLLFAALVTVQLARLDAREIGEVLARRAGTELGLAVRVERAAVSYWPRPALRLGDVRAEDGPRERRLFVEEIDVGLSPFALVVGEVAVRSLHLVRPRLELPLERPTALQQTLETRGETSAAADRVHLLLTSVTIEDGRIEAGSLLLEKVQASGGLGLGLDLTLEVEAEAPGLGRLSAGGVELSGLADAGETHWSAHATVEDLDLAELARRTGIADTAAARGLAGIVLSAEGEGERIAGGTLELRVPDAGIHIAEFGLLGGIALRAELGGSWELDLGEAELRLGDVLSKPLGEELVLSVLPDDRLPPRELREVRLRSGPLSLAAALAREDGDLRLRVEDARVDFARLQPWWRNDWHPLAGQVVVDEAELSVGQSRLTARGGFHSVTLPLPAVADEDAEAPPAARAVVTLDGPFAAEGGEITSEGLSFGIAEQRAVLGGRFDLASRAFEAHVEADDLDVGRVLTAVVGEAVLEGLFRVRATLRGAGNLESLQGSGGFELAKGRIPEADFPWPVEAQDPRLTTGEEGREFDLLEGRFEIADGRAHVDPLSFWHPYLDAHLRGDVRLADGALDLTGELEISEELDAGLGGGGRRRTLPVRSVTGTLVQPHFDLDQDVVAATFRTYAESLRARREP